jgi:hypothetical protein
MIPKNPPPKTDEGTMQNTIDELTEALRQARVHVYRQLNGRHEQDRADALAWLEKWGEL